MRRGTIARVAAAVVVVALIGVLVGVLTGGDSEPKVSGAPREVVATVLQFQKALADRDWQGICARLYTSEARRAAGGARCASTLAQSAGGLRSPHVRIVSVVVRGTSAATVVVAASVNGRPAVTDRIVLEREGGRFRIASAG
jgi:hypothetical protein